MTKRRERDDFPREIDSKDNIWDSVSLENNASCEELTFADPRLKNHGDLESKTSYNFIDSEREEESEETRRKNNRENFSPRISAKNARYRAAKSDAIKERPKILQSRTLNANSPRVKSPRPPIEQTSSVNSAGKSKTDFFYTNCVSSTSKFDSSINRCLCSDNIRIFALSIRNIYDVTVSYIVSSQFFAVGLLDLDA